MATKRQELAPGIMLEVNTTVDRQIVMSVEIVHIDKGGVTVKVGDREHVVRKGDVLSVTVPYPE